MKIKLTDADMLTRNGTQWVLGEWREASGEGSLCGPGWLHCYDSPEIAAFMHPAHITFSSIRAFEAECEGETMDDYGLKRGYTRMRVVREIELPNITTEQRVEIAIRCTLAAGPQIAEWQSWADGWLSGADRSAESAASAARADSAAWAARAAWEARAARAASAVGAAWAARAAWEASVARAEWAASAAWAARAASAAWAKSAARAEWAASAARAKSAAWAKSAASADSAAWAASVAIRLHEIIVSVLTRESVGG